jgi:hypothetical protein
LPLHPPRRCPASARATVWGSCQKCSSLHRHTCLAGKARAFSSPNQAHLIFFSPMVANSRSSTAHHDKSSRSIATNNHSKCSLFDLRWCFVTFSNIIIRWVSRFISLDAAVHANANRVPMSIRSKYWKTKLVHTTTTWPRILRIRSGAPPTTRNHLQFRKTDWLRLG